ncbi:MAG: hypothetical protein AAB966_01245 [Patescibacteria group bacterium]
MTTVDGTGSGLLTIVSFLVLLRVDIVEIDESPSPKQPDNKIMAKTNKTKETILRNSVLIPIPPVDPLLVGSVD